MYQSCQAPSSTALKGIKIVATGQRCQVAKTWLRALQVGPERAQAPSITKASASSTNWLRPAAAAETAAETAAEEAER